MVKVWATRGGTSFLPCQVTHVGSNSGGNWFATQLFYSEVFYSNLVDINVDLGEWALLARVSPRANTCGSLHADVYGWASP